MDQQDRIDRGEIPGISTAESAELRAARRRIRALECVEEPFIGDPADRRDCYRMVKRVALAEQIPRHISPPMAA